MMHVTPADVSRYPALMAYIHDRNRLERAADWCGKLREDQATAHAGGLANVAGELERAQADYATAAKAAGLSPYPYNAAMGDFLGLPLNAAHEPGHGYYMADSVAAHYRLGDAEREVRTLIDAGTPLLVAIARDKRTRKAIRCTRFAGRGQIKIEGNTIVATNGKRRAHLSSGWSVETVMQKTAQAMRSGLPYGEVAP